MAQDTGEIDTTSKAATGQGTRQDWVLHQLEMTTFRSLLGAGPDDPFSSQIRDCENLRDLGISRDLNSYNTQEVSSFNDVSSHFAWR
jgi:hypothetical protein